jgi:uncharacterized membrane protein YeiB
VEVSGCGLFFDREVTSLQSEPTGLKARALGPDLARGFMLLFIALANSHYFLPGESVLGGFPVGGSWLDQTVKLLIATFVDGRAFPMFGLLFGYGVAQIARRQVEVGRPWRSIRFLLWRRSLFLVVLGFIDAMLFYVGDILAAYGVLLFLGVWVLRWKNWVILTIALFFFALTALPSGDPTLATSMDQPDASMLPPNLFAGFEARIGVFPWIALGGPIGFACPFLIGLWAGRRRILEQPERYVGLLTGTAVVGIGAAVLGALPVSLVLAGWADRPDHFNNLGVLHDASGVLGGFGYAALIVLIALKLGGSSRGRITQAVSAVGQRSLTCYLVQSVTWAVVFSRYLLDLSDNLTVAGVAALAIVTWLATVFLAERMDRVAYRGPFEVLIRRFTYRTTRA